MAAVRSGGALEAIYPHTLDEVTRLSQVAVRGHMLKPLTRRVKNEAGKWVDVPESPDEMLARGVLTILQGMEIGLPPMQALQLIAQINGRFVIHSEGVPGLLLSHGIKIKRWWSGTGIGNDGRRPVDKMPADDWAHHTELTRKNGDRYEYSFSIADAKRARLWSPLPRIKKRDRQGQEFEVDNDSPWHLYWPRMLQARSLGFVARDGAADVMSGIMVQEEAEDLERQQRGDMLDVTPVPSGAALAAEIPDEIAGEISDAAPAPATPNATPNATQASATPVATTAVVATEVATEVTTGVTTAASITIPDFTEIDPDTGEIVDAESRETVEASDGPRIASGRGSDPEQDAILDEIEMRLASAGPATIDAIEIEYGPLIAMMDAIGQEMAADMIAAARGL